PKVDHSVDGGDVSTIDSFVALLAPPQIPAPPSGLSYVSPNAADPTLSLRQVSGGVVSGGVVVGETANHSPLTYSPLTFTVMIDDPHPAGSTGMTEATLALRYDPAVLTVSSSDITLGSIPKQ